MRKDKTTGNAAVGAASEARELASTVKSAIDDGRLKLAELFLAEARGVLGEPVTTAAQEVGLTLRLEEATIAQYRGDVEEAWELAEEAVRVADERFGPRGIHVSRARLRRNFALEAKRQFSRALRGNLELADELVRIPNSDALRLNCLTRAIACAVKNADRGVLQPIGLQADPIWQRLDKKRNAGVGRWFLFWCAVASLRQHRVGDAVRLLEHAGGLEATHWRWNNAAGFVLGHGMTLNEATRSKGIELLDSARLDARRRGFHGLVRSIDAGLGS
jgi:hypothetical protein